jgi:TonB family protein
MSACGTRLAAILAFLAASGTSFAQNPVISDSTETKVVMTDLSKPLYPPLARQTHITGDVQLEIRVRQDGSIDSVGIVNGHPLLQQAALDSAKLSRFRCIQCTENVTSQRVVYTFKLIDGGDCCRPAQVAPTSSDQKPPTYPQVSQSGNHILLMDRSACICDPVNVVVRVRSARCLYLWHCRIVHFE